MKRRASCFSVMFVLLASVVDLRAGPETAQTIVKKSVEAMGGVEAIQSVKSLSVRAACMAPEGPFATEVYSYRPDRVLFRQKSDRGSVELGMVGQVGWSRNRETGETKPLPEAMKRFLRGHEFHLLALELDERYFDYRMPEIAPVHERDTPEPCVWIQMEDSWDSPVSACIAKNGHLPVTMIFNAPAELGGDMIWIDFEDWKPIEGVMYFHAFDLYQGQEAFRYDYQSIQPNGVDPSLYVIPEGVSAETVRPKE